LVRRESKALELLNAFSSPGRVVFLRWQVVGAPASRAGVEELQLRADRFQKAAGLGVAIFAHRHEINLNLLGQLATLPHRSENGLEDLIGRTASLFPCATGLRPPPALVGCRPNNPHGAAFRPRYLQLAGR
jgi:hypothetical protein